MLHIKTSVGKLICCQTPNPTTLEQANKNRKKLNLLPYKKRKDISCSHGNKPGS